MSVASTLGEAHVDNLLELTRLLQAVTDFLNSVQEPTFGYVKLRVGPHIQQDLRWISVQTGGGMMTPGQSTTVSTAQALFDETPKTIMGRPINNTPITPAVVTPSKDEHKKFAANVADLYNGFIGMKDKDIASLLNKTGGTALIRGVAKKAGVSGYDTIDAVDMNVEFFAEIRAGIKENAKFTALNTTVENKLIANEEDAEDEDEVPAPVKQAPKKSAAPVNNKKKKVDMSDYE